jgi:tetratricopeptide (TPR) repeat protein
MRMSTLRFKIQRLFWLLLLVILPMSGVMAQEATADVSPAIPSAYQMTGLIHIPQHWNNCGPATLTMGLTYFGTPANQDPAAKWLKPTSEDGNVSPWQMVEYVNKQLAGSVRALSRVGGDLTLLKTLIANNFPVVIEAGYDPEPDRLGWMGHYLLVMGYDDGTQMFMTQDSYLGANTPYTYGHVDEFWEHFNNTYIVLYRLEDEQRLMGLLGTNADPTQNALNALEINRQRALANPNDKFAWFNLGTNYVLLGGYDPQAYQYAASAYDQARTLDLPWRMNWYQFGMYEAYNAVGRYQDVLDLTAIQLREQGTSQYIEETYYYGGIAREGMGERDRALSNLSYALQLNPNFHPAQEAIDQLNGATTASNG